MKSIQIKFGTNQDTENQINVRLPDNSDTLILCVPAMGVSAKQYDKLLGCFVENGFAAASIDLRGNGHSAVRASRSINFGYAELAEEDLPNAISSLRHHYPHYKLVLLGHSLGGQVCSLYLSQHPDEIEHLILAASCSVYYRNWPSPYRWGLLVFAQMAWFISSILGYFPGRNLGFGGRREARSVMRDWAYNARTGDYTLINSQYSYVPFPKLSELKVLAINFSDDELAPAKATDHLLSKISSNRVTRISMTGEDIDRHRATHFNWLRTPENVAKSVSQYLSDLA